MVDIPPIHNHGGLVFRQETDTMTETESETKLSNPPPKKGEELTLLMLLLQKDFKVLVDDSNG